MPQEVKSAIKASPAERQVMFEQCEAVKVAADGFITAVAEGRLADLPDAFYSISAPYEYLAKVLATRVQAAVYEVHQGHEEQS